MIFRKPASEPKIPFGFHVNEKDIMGIREDIKTGAAQITAEAGRDYENAEPAERLVIIVVGSLLGLFFGFIAIALLWTLAKIALPFVAVGMIGWCVYRWWKGLPLFPAGKISFKKK